ncbi:MAG: sigma-E factor negative regulatory protein [Gammaproteobacteria bacterium]|nr:sigma-E factor negative regulatory protein [Gammaproteobacteria bacterium]
MDKLPEAMPDPVAEQLSAWLDDELPAAELELLVARLGHGQVGHGRLARYGLIGAALRGDPALPAARRLGERVRRALESGREPEVAAGRLPAVPLRSRSWQENVVPFAAAATVLLTLFLMATVRGPSLAPDAAAQAGRTGVLMPVAVAAEMRGPARSSAPAPLSRQRLTDYLVMHGEYSGTLAVQVADSHIVNDRSYAAAGYARVEYSAK